MTTAVVGPVPASPVAAPSASAPGAPQANGPAPAGAAAAPAAPAAPPKLLVTRSEAIRMIQAQLEKGQEVKRVKIRYVPELEKARQMKADWTTSTMVMLNGLFDSNAVADECQKWVGRVLPEYADLSLFIEHFYDEMDQRLRKLHVVLKRVQALPPDAPRTISPQPEEEPAPAPGAAASAGPAGPAGPGAPANGARAPRAAAPRGAPAVRRAVLALLDPAAPGREVVETFVHRLGFEVTCIPAAKPADGAAPAEGAAAPAEGAAAPADGAGPGDPAPRLPLGVLDDLGRPDFALLLAGPRCRPAEFDLGFFVGRLGAGRVLVVTPAPDAASCPPAAVAPVPGVPHIPLDAADAWQLHLARHLKRAGVDVDLNRAL